MKFLDVEALTLSEMMNEAVLDAYGRVLNM
jgi:hypothetical protein